MRNGALSDNSSIARAIEGISSRLPEGWTVSLRNRATRLTDYQPDAVMEIHAPDGRRALLLVEAKRQLTAQVAADLGPRLATAAAEAKVGGALVITRFASPMTRDRLSRAGISYFDLTGNARIALDRPAVLIETQGEDKDPNPPRRPVKSLKGAKAARLVRALCDWRPPVGVRQLARRAGADPGYTSRVISFLEKEDVIRRDSSGEITEISWQDLLRRWAQDYQVTKSNSTASYLAPRGVDSLIASLRSYDDRWALTGSLAVPDPASIAPARIATCYVNDAARAAKYLDLRQTESGANTLLLEPFDKVVWERTRSEDGLSYVAVSQCAVDLLTGTGREPAQAESLLTWMAENENAWRA